MKNRKLRDSNTLQLHPKLIFKSMEFGRERMDIVSFSRQVINMLMGRVHTDGLFPNTYVKEHKIGGYMKMVSEMAKDQKGIIVPEREAKIGSDGLVSANKINAWMYARPGDAHFPEVTLLLEKEKVWREKRTNGCEVAEMVVIENAAAVGISILKTLAIEESN